jgi:cobalt-zinc-cadmium efflux system outer membrane protein
LAVRALMGLAPDADVRLVPGLPDAVAGPADPAGRRRWVEAHHPRLHLARAEHAAAERRLELEVRRQYPDLTLGGGYGREESTTRFLGGLSLPLPVFNANRRAIAEARAERDAARAAAEATYEELMSALARAEAAADAARVRREGLEREVIPAADEQLRAARDLGRLGDAGPIVLSDALAAAQQAQADVLDAAGRAAAARNRLNDLLRAAPGVEPPATELGAKETP